MIQEGVQAIALPFVEVQKTVKNKGLTVIASGQQMSMFLVVKIAVMHKNTKTKKT